MKLDISRLAQATTLAAVAILAVIGGFLFTLPLHPQAGDSHRGLMAMFPGVLLLIFGLLIYLTGRWLNRRGHGTSLISILISGTTIVTVVALAFG